jgi:hypothetical protein
LAVNFSHRRRSRTRAPPRASKRPALPS